MKIGKINSYSVLEHASTSVLAQFEGMPNTIHVAGNLPKQQQPSIAIIGSRRPTTYGKSITQQLARDLASQGVVIISGLAYGIDTVAHQAALEAGGTTIAVMANGLHRIYPASNSGLAEQIVASGGAIVSEQPLGVDAQKYHFLARNRIISGLADAVLVTEATDHSGTFSTVSHAISQNKEIMAVPGPITSLLSAGPNRLIQEGAHVILNVDDILDIIAPNLKTIKHTIPLGDTPQEMNIIEQLHAGVTDIDELLKTTTSNSSEVLQTITMLELKGVVQVEAGHVRLLY